jgi:hypothetical protein
VLFCAISFLRINLTMRDTLSSDPSASEAEGLADRMVTVDHVLDHASCDKAASTTQAPTGLPVPTASTLPPLHPAVVGFFAGIVERVLPAKRSLEQDSPIVPKQTGRRKSKKDPVEVVAQARAAADTRAAATAAAAAKAAEREDTKAAAATLPSKRIQSAAAKAAAVDEAQKTALADAASRDAQADADAIAALDAAVAAAAAVERRSAVASPTTETAKVARARRLEVEADL